MKAHRGKALAALALAIGMTGCAATDRSGTTQSLADERAELQRTFGPTVEIEAGEALQAALAHSERFNELDGVFSEALAKGAGVDAAPPSLWELHPGILYARLVLIQAALNGEVASKVRRQCELVKAGEWRPKNDQSARCDWAQSCDRQHLETLSTCHATLATQCRFPAGALCRKYRQTAYNLCRDVADCQLACCLGSCNATNCAARAATGKIGEQGANCPTCAATPPPRMRRNGDAEATN